MIRTLKNILLFGSLIITTSCAGAVATRITTDNLPEINTCCKEDVAANVKALQKLLQNTGVVITDHRKFGYGYGSKTYQPYAVSEAGISYKVEVTYNVEAFEIETINEKNGKLKSTFTTTFYGGEKKWDDDAFISFSKVSQIYIYGLTNDRYKRVSKQYMMDVWLHRFEKSKFCNAPIQIIIPMEDKAALESIAARIWCLKESSNK